MTEKLIVKNLLCLETPENFGYDFRTARMISDNDYSNNFADFPLPESVVAKKVLLIS